MTTIYRVLASLPLALVLVLMCETPATSAVGCVPTGGVMFNRCADLDPSLIDDLRTDLADSGVRLVR